MQSPACRSLKRVGIYAIMLVLLATPAVAAQKRKMTLVLKGGTPAPPATFCAVTPDATNFLVDGTVGYTGRVSPSPPTGAKVKVVVKRCYDDATLYSPGFRTVLTLTARVHAKGAFSGSFPVHVPSNCFVQASYRRSTSNRAYFSVS